MNYMEQVERNVQSDVDQKTRVRRYLANTTACDAVFADIAEGTPVTKLAKRLNVKYHALYATLTTSPYREKYNAARAAHASKLAEKNLDLADKVENMEVPSEVAKTAVGIRTWYMERTDREQWGQKSSVDVTHKGVVGLHLDAIRQLANEPLEGEFVEVGNDDATDGDGLAVDHSPEHSGDDNSDEAPLKGSHLL